MQIPTSRDREALEDILRKNAWQSLQAYSVKIIEQRPIYAAPPKDEQEQKERAQTQARLALDCGNYVLDQLGFPLNPKMIEGLQKMGKTPQPRGDGIIFYRSWGREGMNTVHYGLMRGDIVRSKWGNNSPILEHPIEQVPTSFGLYVEFCPRKKALETLHALQQISMFGGDAS